MTVNVHEAKTQLSKLLERVDCGEETVICRVPARAARRVLGGDKGRVGLAPDFDAPLPDDLLAGFER
jgi:antitoxin (DNA-binding transcriptional repressor) of toxin-antitoxin stability system